MTATRWLPPSPPAASGQTQLGHDIAELATLCRVILNNGDQMLANLNQKEQQPGNDPTAAIGEIGAALIGAAAAYETGRQQQFRNAQAQPVQPINPPATTCTTSYVALTGQAVINCH